MKSCFIKHDRELVDWGRLRRVAEVAEVVDKTFLKSEIHHPSNPIIPCLLQSIRRNDSSQSALAVDLTQAKVR